jgi:SAM-dependent methyltransferase
MKNNDNRALDMIVDELLNGKKNIKILEAGCGSMSHFHHQKGSHLVGIDISQEQLDKNTYLHEKILGDLEGDDLPASAFDLIVCWDVLEHLPHPTLALKNFAHAAKPGGVILLASPNVFTVRGLVTKASPHWFKIWYYKRICGVQDAGKPGNYPFEAFHRFAMSPPAIQRFAKHHGLSVELCRFSNWKHPENSYMFFNIIWNSFNRLVKILTFGLIGTDNEQGFQILLKKL